MSNNFLIFFIGNSFEFPMKPLCAFRKGVN